MDKNALHKRRETVRHETVKTWYTGPQKAIKMGVLPIPREHQEIFISALARVRKPGHQFSISITGN